MVWCSTRFSTARFASHSETLVRRTLQCTMRFRLAPASGAATKPNPKDKLDRSPTGMRTPPQYECMVVNYNALSVVVWWVVMDTPHIPGPEIRHDACSSINGACIQVSRAVLFPQCVQSLGNPRGNVRFMFHTDRNCHYSGHMMVRASGRCPSGG